MVFILKSLGQTMDYCIFVALVWEIMLLNFFVNELTNKFAKENTSYYSDLK